MKRTTRTSPSAWTVPAIAAAVAAPAAAVSLPSSAQAVLNTAAVSLSIGTVGLGRGATGTKQVPAGTVVLGADQAGKVVRIGTPAPPAVQVCQATYRPLSGFFLVHLDPHEDIRVWPAPGYRVAAEHTAPLAILTGTQLQLSYAAQLPADAESTPGRIVLVTIDVVTGLDAQPAIVSEPLAVDVAAACLVDAESTSDPRGALDALQFHPVAEAS